MNEIARLLVTIRTQAQVVREENPNQVVYREKDVIALLQHLGHSAPIWDGSGQDRSPLYKYLEIYIEKYTLQQNGVAFMAVEQLDDYSRLYSNLVYIENIYLKKLEDPDFTLGEPFTEYALTHFINIVQILTRHDITVSQIDYSWLRNTIGSSNRPPVK